MEQSPHNLRDSIPTRTLSVPGFTSSIAYGLAFPKDRLRSIKALGLILNTAQCHACHRRGLWSSEFSKVKLCLSEAAQCVQVLAVKLTT